MKMAAPNYISSLEPGQKYGVDIYVNTINEEEFF
jgi:hypothetical protein